MMFLSARNRHFVAGSVLFMAMMLSFGVSASNGTLPDFEELSSVYSNAPEEEDEMALLDEAGDDVDEESVDDENGEEEQGALLDVND